MANADAESALSRDRLLASSVESFAVTNTQTITRRADIAAKVIARDAESVHNVTLTLEATDGRMKRLEQEINAVVEQMVGSEAVVASIHNGTAGALLRPPESPSFPSVVLVALHLPEYHYLFHLSLQPMPLVRVLAREVLYHCNTTFT